MGAGAWSAATYSSTTQRKIDTGSSFSYSSATHSQSQTTWASHEDLDPKKVAGAGSPLAGQIVRESRDSDDHPNSQPLAVFFDETGSMGGIPVTLQTKLAQLFGLLLRKGYVEDPQVLVGAYGDAYTDRVPLQVSQFESDNRIDEALDKLFIEGNGGGNGGESMSLAWYYLAHHTATDAWDKRGKKGCAFFIGDEDALPLRPEQVREVVGDGEPLGDLTNKGVVDALLERWDAYVLVIDNGSALRQGSVQFYRDLFGERAIVLDNPDAVAETIALLVGMLEGTIDLDGGVQDLRDAGSSSTAITSVSRALATVGSTRRGSLVTGGAPSDLATTDSGSSGRL